MFQQRGWKTFHEKGTGRKKLSGLGNNYIRIWFFLKLKLESTKLRSNSPFFTMNSSTWVWPTRPCEHESQDHPRKRSREKLWVTAYGLGWAMNHSHSLSCQVRCLVLRPLCLPWCPAWLLGFVHALAFAAGVHCIVGSSFLYSVVTSWLPSFILFFSWVVRFSPNWFARTLCELRKLALFNICWKHVSGLLLFEFRICFFLNKCLDEFDYINILISSMISRFSMYFLEIISYSKIINPSMPSILKWSRFFKKYWLIL